MKTNINVQVTKSMVLLNLLQANIWDLILGGGRAVNFFFGVV